MRKSLPEGVSTSSTNGGAGSSNVRSSRIPGAPMSRSQPRRHRPPRATAVVRPTVAVRCRPVDRDPGIRRDDEGAGELDHRCESIASGTKKTVPAFQQSSAGSTDPSSAGSRRLDQRCRRRVSAKGTGEPCQLSTGYRPPTDWQLKEPLTPCNAPLTPVCVSQRSAGRSGLSDGPEVPLAASVG